MNALVRDTMTALARERVGRRVELRLEPLPPCLGDQPLLGHVWQNLLGNALKYTSRRDVAHIEVRGSIDAAAGQATYVVTDDGAGFDMRHAGRLFGPFQRLHRADEFEGTGVGLAIAQRIVHRHGGRIWGEGEPGVGATFSFSLPSTPLGPTGEGA
jgi:light-regulated signal transduction histidine kinase (bacteriophytochrome)